MPLTVVRFNLSETVPVRNVPRGSLPKSVLPIGFPFVFDDVPMEPVEPILLFLLHKYANAGDFHHGRWTKDNTASAAVADLKDWWTSTQVNRIPWDCADDDTLAGWILDMRMAPSGVTADWLSEKTINRRLSCVNGFYLWALNQGLVERVPDPVSARLIAGNQLTDSCKQSREDKERNRTHNSNPHPISAAASVRLAEALGPLPSDRNDLSSRTRLVYETGLEVGARIDEILNLPVAFFQGFRSNPDKPFVMMSFRMEHTKGLVPREVHFPAWLMQEFALYIEGERAAAITQARRTWLRDGQIETPFLFVNQAAAGHNAGKQTQSSTIQEEFNKACIRLELTRRKVLAIGTEDAKLVLVPKHTFHDTRHTYAVSLYMSLEEQGYPRPWLRVQKRLGHAQVSTTINTYLAVIDDLGDEAREQVSRTFHEIRTASREAAHAQLHHGIIRLS